MILETQRNRAEGCFLGSIAGDSLGSLVEFRSPEDIKAQYPKGVYELADGGTWNTIAGQPTDATEMALIMARSIVKEKTYDHKAVLEAYLWWRSTNPFDIGFTTMSGLSGMHNFDRQANGALMRIAPVGIYASTKSEEDAFALGFMDAGLTHPNEIRRVISGLFSFGISIAIRETLTGPETFERMLAFAKKTDVPSIIISVIEYSREYKPASFMEKKGWVLIAFHNAMYHLHNTKQLERAIVETVNQGGDTATNAAIVGAIHGAVSGRHHIPIQWEEAILSCKTKKSGRVKQPRPKQFWPTDVIELTNELLDLK